MNDKCTSIYHGMFIYIYFIPVSQEIRNVESIYRAARKMSVKQK